MSANIFNIALFCRKKVVVILGKILLNVIFSGVQLTLLVLHERSHYENVFVNRF